VSERGFQLERGTQWTKRKSCDSFAPLGPWLVTADDIRDPGTLDRKPQKFLEKATSSNSASPDLGNSGKL
jgi:2-keto-4-pentenoate hydratase/2-oxohepta-3-ene-1,7-dioic acid hydratase in catechol pathway